MGVSGKGEGRGEGIMHSCSKKEKEEEARRDEGREAPRAGRAGSPQVASLGASALCSR